MHQSRDEVHAEPAQDLLGSPLGFAATPALANETPGMEAEKGTGESKAFPQMKDLCLIGFAYHNF